MYFDFIWFMFIIVYIYIHTQTHPFKMPQVNQHLTVPSPAGGMVSGRHGSGASGRNSLFPLPCEWCPDLSRMRSEKKPVAMYGYEK
jgi:hypothetical protein